MVATLLPKLYGIPTFDLSFASGKTYLLSPRRGPLTHPLTIKGSKLITDKAYSEAKMRTTTHKQLVETLVGPWGVKKHHGILEQNKKHQLIPGRYMYK